MIYKHKRRVPWSVIVIWILCGVFSLASWAVLFTIGHAVYMMNSRDV